MKIKDKVDKINILEKRLKDMRIEKSRFTNINRTPFLHTLITMEIIKTEKEINKLKNN